MNEIVLIGSGGHTRSCIDVIESTGQYKIAGLVEKNNSDITENLGYPVIGKDDDLSNLRKKYKYAIITIGQIKSVARRIRLYKMLYEMDYELPMIVSPRSHLSQYSKIGYGTIIMHDVIVNANAEIGNNCIINNKSLIEHDAIIGNHCHIATGTIINGNVTVGSKSFIGSGTVTKQAISIGKNCVIGAGSVIKTDVESNQIIKN